MSKTYQIKNFGRFLKFPKKYKGRLDKIDLRSSWEIKFAIWLDECAAVIEWNSEEVVVPYYFESTRRWHRYYVDFWFKVLEKDGSIREYLVEIKPHKQTLPPPEGKRRTKAYWNSIATYARNQTKWKAAKALCEEERAKGKPIEFVVLTEKDLPV